MAKKYNEHPLGKLSETQLDQILADYGSSYSTKNQKNIARKFRLKKRQPVLQVTFSKRNLLLIAVLLLFFIPISTYLAAKLWEITVEKQDYELTTSINKTVSPQPDTGYYRLVADYVPDYLTAYDDSPELYFYEELNLDPENPEHHEALSQARSLTFTLYELKEKTTVIDEYVKDYKEIKLTNGSAYLIETTDGSGKISAAKARVFFEDKNMFAEMNYSGNISEKEIKKILENLSLVNVATMEEATWPVEYMSMDDWIAMLSEGYEEQEPWQLDPNIKEEVVQLNEPINRIGINGEPLEEITVIKATLSEAIPPKTLAILEERSRLGIDDTYYGKAWDETGKLLPFTVTKFAAGDGKRTLDEQLQEVELTPKYLELELTVKNIAEEAMDYLFYAPVEGLVRQGDYFTHSTYETFLARETLGSNQNPYEMLGEYYNQLPTSVGTFDDEGFYQEELAICSIEPGETITVKVSYILASEDYNDLFLNLNHASPENRYVQLTP